MQVEPKETDPPQDFVVLYIVALSEHSILPYNVFTIYSKNTDLIGKFYSYKGPIGWYKEVFLKRKKGPKQQGSKCT